MDNNTILNAFLASINNYKKLNNSDKSSRGLLYKIKYIAWFILLLFFSPRKEDNSDTFAACMTPVNEKRIHDFKPDANLYRFAKLNNSLSSIRKNISVVSDINFFQRIGILFQGINFYIGNKEQLNGYFHLTVEYYAIAMYLERKNYSIYITPGMYERYCTLISYLGKINGAKIIGVQDGAAIDIKVPAKLYCDEMYCFDEYEAEIIKKFIANSDCQYIYTGFKSVLKFDHFHNTGKKIMAIASQDWFTDKTVELASAIMKSTLPEKWDVILLPHYRESEDSYKTLKESFPGIILEPKRRFDNIDLLITFYSTIVYDYWSVNSRLPVFCLQIPGFHPGYYGRDNVYVFDSAERLITAIKGLR